MLRLVRRLASDAPVVLALDDLHWADGTSRALAKELVALVAVSPLLLVLGCSEEWLGSPSMRCAGSPRGRRGSRSRPSQTNPIVPY